MKNLRRLIPAFAMLLVSAVLMTTASYAWFSMNTQVTANGMQVKAKAEGGIVISNSAKTSWVGEISGQVQSATLFPTSNAKNPTDKWYHNKSTDANDAMAGQVEGSYAELGTTLSGTNEGVAFVDTNANSSYDAGTDAAYYLMDQFFIKSSGEVMNPATLYINEVSVTSNASLLAIDNALRVCIVVKDTAFLFAPVSVAGTSGPTLTYNVAGSATETTALAGSVKNTNTGVSTIGNTDAEAVPVSIYIYFEGEDANCKSSNIATIDVDTLTVSVKFGTTTIS